MNNCCIYLRIRSKKYQKYFYCASAKKEIDIETCRNCPFKRKTKTKSIKKTTNRSIIEPGYIEYETSIPGTFGRIRFYNKPAKGLHKHHIFNGCGLRDLSEKYGLYIYVKALDHVLSSDSLHENPKLMLTLKRIGQISFQKAFPDLDFIQIFGRNYL